MKRLTLLLALLLPACVNQETVDYAFCDADEACFSVVEPEPVVCGGIECTGHCGVTFECKPGIGGGEVCAIVEALPGEDDGDLCTYDSCNASGTKWKHEPIPAADMDDGDPCTIDECSPGTGIYHVPSCG